MAKTRAAILLILITVIFALVFSISDAHPAVEPTENNDYHLNNGSRLVITNIVKTIEFEVGVADDDNTTNNNLTSFNDTVLYETDIHLLDADLLKELVNEVNKETKAKNTKETTEETLAAVTQT